MKRSLRAFISPLLALLIYSGEASADTPIFSENFNSSAPSWTNNFTESEQASGTSFTWGSTSGVSNSGGVLVNGSPEIAYYNNAVDGFSTNGEYTISVFLRLRSKTVGTAGDTAFATGLLASTSDVMGSSSGTNTYMTIRARMNPVAAGAETSYQFLFLSKSGSGSRISNVAEESFSVVDGNWYQFVTSYHFDEVANTFTGSAKLWDYGESGDLATPILVASYTSAPLANAHFETAAEMYAALQAGNQSYGGVSRLDNFELTAIPEPSGVAAGMAATLLFVVGVNKLRRDRKLGTNKEI